MRDITVEVEHVKAHRTKKAKKEMSHFEKFVTEGNGKADDLANAGAMLDERVYGGSERQCSRSEKRCTQLCSTAASFHCLVEEWTDCEELKPKPKEKLIFVDQKKEGTKHRTEWWAETNKYRCMRCGKKQQIHEDARKMHRTKILV